MSHDGRYQPDLVHHHRRPQLQEANQTRYTCARTFAAKGTCHVLPVISRAMAYRWNFKNNAGYSKFDKGALAPQPFHRLPIYGFDKSSKATPSAEQSYRQTRPTARGKERCLPRTSWLRTWRGKLVCEQARQTMEQARPQERL